LAIIPPENQAESDDEDAGVESVNYESDSDEEQRQKFDFFSKIRLKNKIIF
jgi:hypothetical protein